jgi:predicted nucleotidyltransferase component of viral defense system
MLHHSTVDAPTFALLQKIFELPTIHNQFALAGGTSLALQLGHRKSIDLDLFSPQSFLPADIENLLAGNALWQYEPMSQSTRMLFCSINKIKCDFVNEPFPLINPFIETENIKLYSVADIAAMKMHTICGRGKKKDFFDIYALLEHYDWKQMIEWFKQKYGDSQLFFLWKSIAYFLDADDDIDIRGIAPYHATWAQVKEIISNKCR